MSSSITITVDGQSKQVEADQRPTHLFADNPKVVVAKINGEIRDLWTELKDGDQLEAIEIGSPEGLAVLRHSTAHVLAQAVQEVFPETKLGKPFRQGKLKKVKQQAKTTTTLRSFRAKAHKEVGRHQHSYSLF